MTERTEHEVRSAVREHYATVAKTNGAVGCAPSCCSPTTGASLALGYSAEDLASVPEGADMGLGCGNPQAFEACCEISRDARGHVLSFEPRAASCCPTSR